jgi:hypothetical protein
LLKLKSKSKKITRWLQAALCEAALGQRRESCDMNHNIFWGKKQQRARFLGAGEKASDGGLETELCGTDFICNLNPT